MATGAAVESKTDRPIEGWRDRRVEGESGGGTDVGLGRALSSLICRSQTGTD